MMVNSRKNIFYVLIIIAIASSVIYGCKKDDLPYFKGEIITIDNFAQEIVLKGEKVDLGDINEGQPFVCDSFLVFVTFKYPDYYFYAFDIKSGKHIASFCPKGNGPNDFLSCDMSYQLVKKDGESKIWVRDYNNQKIHLINVTRSIAQQTTICDSIVPFEWSKFFQYPLTGVFFLDKGEILGINQCEDQYSTGEEYKPRDLYLFKESFNNKIRDYHLYQRPVISLDHRVKFENFEFYNSSYRIKPDNTMLAIAMKMLGQISIVDIKTGVQKNFRMKESITFPDIEKDVYKTRRYYSTMAVSDKYIFAIYVDVALKDTPPPFGGHIIHVFTWNGEPVYRVHVKESIKNITLDVPNQLLYAVDLEDNLYSYDISGIQ